MAAERIIRTFSAADYAVFGVMLFVSAIIGIFYAVKDRKRNSDTEVYLMAGRSMGIVPVALSLTVSFMSAITILGTPAEIYVNGTMYWWTVASIFLVVLIVSEIYIPTFYKLRISSTYEYLELRFSRPVRILGTVAYIIQNILYIGIVIYAPALALNQVTGFTLWGSVMTTGVVCTFYTTLGGLKAVIWTDVFQSVIMCGGFVAILIRGSMLMGGFANIWKIADEAGRIDFVHFETDIHIRHTSWGFLVGGTMLWLGVYGISQSQVQRYLCCKSERDAKLSLVLNWFGVGVIISLACMCGCVLYAFYKDCDPLSKGCIGAADQLLPYLVMEMFEDYPGVPGLFVACVYSGGLSTVSSGINAMSTVTVEDFIKPFTKLSPNTYAWISKGAVILYGAVSLGVAYMASQLGGILQAALSIFGIVGGPLIGLFTLGLMFPFGNSVGAFIGTIAGLSFTIWIYLGSKSYPLPAVYRRTLNLTTECEATCFVNNFAMFNFTTTTTAPITTTFTFDSTTATEEPVIPAIASLYHSSYLYLSCYGFIAALGVGVIFSLISCGWRDRKSYDPELLCHFFDMTIFRWVPLKFRRIMRCGVDASKKQRRSSKKTNQDCVLQCYTKNTSSSPPHGQNNPAYEKDLSGTVAAY